MQRRTVIGILAICLVMTACATRRPIEGQKAGELDRKLSKFAYIEEGKLVTLIVDRGDTCAALCEAAGVHYQPLLTAADLGFGPDD